MRPLAIWAMHWALYPPKCIAEAPRVPSIDRASSHSLYAGFTSVAEALRNPLPQLRRLRSLCQELHSCLCCGRTLWSTETVISEIRVQQFHICCHEMHWLVHQWHFPMYPVGNWVTSDESLCCQTCVDTCWRPWVKEIRLMMRCTAACEITTGTNLVTGTEKNRLVESQNVWMTLDM